MVGLASGLALFLLFGFAGWTDTTGGEITLLFLLYVTLLMAGYFAGRFGPEAAIRNGMWAATALVALNVVLTSPNISMVGLVTAVALGGIVGAAGGALARFQSEG